MRLSRRAYAAIGLGLLIVLAAWWAGWVRPSYGVALTSRSMSHADVNLPGVLDPGERISVDGISGRDDVVTYLHGVERDHRVGDEFGDVIAFDAKARGRDAGIGVVHRAMAWVEYDEASDAYDVPELGLQDVRTVVFPEVGTWDPYAQEYVRVRMDVVLNPDLAGRHDGWLTKGDHNYGFDQDAYGGLEGIGPVELVEVAYANGKVVDFLEGEESFTMFYVAFGVAAVVAGGGFLFRDRLRGLRSRAAASRGACAGCGARMGGQEPFCVRCGRSR